MLNISLHSHLSAIRLIADYVSKELGLLSSSTKVCGLLEQDT